MDFYISYTDIYICIGFVPVESILQAILKKSPIYRTCDLESLGISRTQLRHYVANGVLENPSRGLYTVIVSKIYSSGFSGKSPAGLFL